jgi:WD40 repeat protein
MMRLTQSIFSLFFLAGSCCCLTAAEAGAHLDAYGNSLPPGAVARLGCLRFRSGEAVESVALSPDGKVAASLGSTSAWSTLCLWDTASGRLLHRFRRPELGGGLTFSSDGKFLLEVVGLNEVQLWDVAARRAIRRYRTGSWELFWCAGFSPDGSLVAAAGRKGMCVWERATGRLRWRLGHEEPFGPIAFSADGKTLACAEKDHAICLRETSTGKLLQRCRGHSGEVGKQAFSPDGKTLTSTDDKGKVYLWETATGKPIRQDRTLLRDTRALAFSPDGKLLAVRKGRTVEVYEAATGKKVSSYRGHQGDVRCACFSRDGKRLLSGGDDGTLCLRVLDAPESPRQEAGHARDVTALAFSPDGRTLASGGHDGTVRLWDVSTSRQLCVRAGHEHTVTLLSFAPDGKLLVSIGSDVSKTHGWEVRPERHLHCAWKHSWEAAALSPDGKTVAAVTLDGISLWDAWSGKELRRLVDGCAVSLCYSVDGKTLAWGGVDNSVHFWEVATGRQVQVRQDQSTWEHQLVSCADGKTWAGVDYHGLLEVWNASSGKRLCRMWDVQGCAFSPDGRLLVAGGEEGRLRLHEVTTGKEVLRWQGHDGFDVRAVTFSPDGRLFATGSQDGTILLWDLDLVLHGRKPRADRLSDREMESLWQALAGSDLRRAYQAVGLLAAVPGQSIPFLRQRLHPAKMDGERVQRLLAELDGDDFDVREKAARRLADFGEVIELALRQALASGPSSEVARRVERLLEGIKQQVWTAEQLRQLRCLAVLERASTPAARRLLQRLAEGAEGARLTQAARTALRRLVGGGEPRRS